MGEIKEIKKVEEDSLSTMQNKVKEGYDKFNDGRGGRKYSDELRFGCQQVINQIDSKVNKGFSQLNGPKSKLSKDYRAKRDIFAKKSKNIRESIKKCCDSWTNVKRVHKDRLNNLAGWIDNYENDVVKIVNDLIDQQNEMQGVLKKEQATGKNYFDIKDGVYTLTKDTNLPKIHEVFDGVVKPGEKWMIDYSECKNATIKNRMLSTMGGYRCYLHCDKKKGTYFVSTSEIKPNENDGNKMMGISTQRALIREGVKIVPNSKITKDAKAAIEANAKKEANKGLTNDEKSNLKTTMPKKLREKLSEKPGLRDEFFTKTEYDLKNIILRAKSADYKLTGEVCSRNGYTKNGRILEIHLIQGSTEVDWPLLTSKFSNPLFNRLDDREGDLVSYMKNRIKQLRGKLSYADKHETVIQGQRQTEKTTAKEIEDSKKLKENALYGLGLVGTLIDNLIEKKGNTWMTNDDQILSKCKTYVEDAIYSIENADIITKDNLTQIQNRLTDNIRPFYLNQLSFGISGLTKKEQVSKQLSNIISGPKAKAIKGVRKLGEWTTVFDNEETSFLRDEIVDNMDVKNATINETRANNCFKNIQKFLVGDDDIDRSKGEVKSGKKSLIDGLYSAAGDGTGEKLLKYMQDKGIMSKTVTFNNKKIKELSKNLASFLRRKEKNVKETLDGISTESVKQGLIQKKTQLEASNNLSEEQIRELNYYNYAIYEMPSDEFEEIVKEEKIKLSILRYQGVDDVLRSNLTPWLVKEGKGMKGIDNADILNDSLGTGGIFDRSDENCAKIGPIIKEIIEEVIITAVSILLSPTGAGEALYVSFRLAKAATKGLKGIAKLMKFLQKFAGAFAKLTARQFASKFSVRAAKSAKTVKNASRIVKGAEEVRGLKKIKYVCQTIKNTESLGSLCGKLAMKGTSLMIEGAAFHLNSTLIHNAIQGKRLGDGLNPFDYTEGPDGEKIPNRKSYAQSIAFLGILKTLGKSIQGVTGKWIEGISKGKYELNIAQKFLSNALSIGGEMGSMMVTDQILSIAFDHKFKEITGEDLIIMFGMIAGLRLNGKFEVKIQEYDKKSVTLEMKQGENTFNVKIDGQGNVLKVEGVDGSGRKFAHPEKELGIRSKVDGENLRATRAGQEVGTVEGNIRELGNLHEGDVITVKHGEKDVRLKKNDKGNWEIEDAGGIESDRFRPGEEFVVKENSDGSGYHLETKAGSGPKISLDGRVRVRLKGGESNGNRAPERGNTGGNEGGPKEPAPDMTQQRRQELLTKKNDLVKKKENHERRRSELENKKKTLENKKTDLLSQREANWRSLDGQKNNIGKINDILKQGNKITIDRLEYQFIGIKNGKAKFVIDKAAKKSAESRNLHFEETVEVSSLSELLDSRFNLEPGKKGTNSGRYDKLHELINDKVEPLDRLKNKIRNKTAEIKLLEQEIAGLEKGNNTLAHNDYFGGKLKDSQGNIIPGKYALVGKKVWIDGVKYSAERINPDGTLQFKEVDGNKNFTISSFKQLAEKGDYINGFSDYLDANGRPQKQGRNMSNSEIQNDKLIKGLISGEAEYLSSRDIDQTLSEKRANLQVAQQELKGLQDKLPASQARQKKIDARAQRGKEINRDLRQVEQELDKVNADLGEADRLVKKYQDEIDQVDRDLSENDGVKEEPKKEDNNSEQNTGGERKENPKNNEGEVEQGIEKAEDVENEINKMLSDKTNTGNYKNLKLDWVTQKMFETGIFIEGVKNRFKNLKSGTSIPKQFLKNLRDKLVDMKTRFGTKLSEYHSKLVDNIRSAIDQKLAKDAAQNIVNDIKKINLSISKEYDLGNGEKIRLKKLDNGRFVEVEKFGGKTVDEAFVEVHKGKEMTEGELVEFLKGKIVENMNKQPGHAENQGRQRQATSSEGIIQVNGVTPEWGKSMEIKSRGEFYDNGVLKKGEKYLDNNGLVCESGEYDINGNMIKGEKYKYNADIYDHEGKPINGTKTTLFIGHEYLVSKKGRINKLGDYTNPNRGEYEYKDGSKFSGDVDNTSHPKQGRLTLKNGIIKEGDFVNGQLKNGIEISNSGGIKKVKFAGDVTKDQMNRLATHIEPGETAEIELVNGEKVTIKNIEGKFEELLGNPGGVELTHPIEGKLGEYLEKRINNKNPAPKIQPERDQRQVDGPERQRKTAEDAERQRVKDNKKEQERFEDIPEVEIIGTEIQEFELNMLRNLRKGRNEKIYLNEFGEPKNVLPLGNGENLYVSNCLEYGYHKYIVGYVQKGGELELRLFYRSNSEGARRSCPGERAKRDKNGNIVSGGYSKGEGITNSSYETTTRVINELQYKFDRLPTETAYSDPISMEGKGVGYNILEPAMQSEIKVDKLFNGQYGQYNNTVDYIKGHTVAEVKDMYRRLGVGIDTSGMKIVEGKGYTYEHQYLGTIEVKVCRLNYNGKDLDFSFSKVKNDPQNRVRIEEVNYADAKVSSFGIYDKQINVAPLTGKPIDYANERHWQVPKDQNGTRYGGTYMDIRDLYQENPFIKKFKEISQKDQVNPQDLRQRQAEQERQRQAELERQRQAEQERQRQAEQERQRQAEQERQRQAEAERQRQAEADARAREEAEAKRKAAEEAEAKRKAAEEAEAKRKAAEEAARQKKAAEDAKENRKREIKHTYKELIQEFHPNKNGIGVLFKDIVGRDMNNGEKTRFQKDSENMKNSFERISQKLNELKENNDLDGLKNIYDKRIEIKEKIQQKIKEQFEDIKRAEEARRAEAARRVNANQDRQKKNINGYTKNLKTEDGGIFSGEIKNGEIYEGIFVDKDGGRRYINKASEYPVMKYQDKILLDKILSKESVNVGELKWTHRTNFETLQQIINSGVIGNNGSRGVQFWGGLGACYGDVVLIMKDSVMNLPAAPENLNKGDGNYNYFFSGAGAKDRTWSQFQQEASDFSFRRQGRGENPNIDVPYLSIGGKNGTHGNFNHEVGVDHIEAVMIPAHAKNNPGYKELVRKLNAKGIKVIEVQTENNILDYAGGSILFANDGRRGSFDVAIKAELSRRYPNLKTFQEQAIAYLRDTGRINYIEGKSFDEYREDYLNVSAENGLSRGATRGGQYQNYSSQKNYTREQQAYFRYIIESRIAKERGSYPHPTVGSNRFSKAA